MNRIKQFVTDFGWPRIIIFIFLIFLFVMAPFVNVRIGTSLSDVINRFGMNAILVLAIVPMVQSGCGLNFGLALGIISGLLGATLSIQFGMTGWAGMFGAMVLSLPFSVAFGLFYGKLLNKVKGDEMVIATYIGFAVVMFMCILWLILPYNSPTMIYGFSGKGLRPTISVEGFWLHQLSNFLSVKAVNLPGGGLNWIFHAGLTPDIAADAAYDAMDTAFFFPTGMLIFCGVCAWALWLFFRSKTGTAITAVGSNPDFARAGGINVDRMRTTSTVISTILAGIGIVVYQQSFGFIQLYNAPLVMAFPAVAAILLGGASVNKASMVNVIVGTFLFQGILTMTPSVINSMLQTDMSEVVRIVVSNGLILYALTRKTKVAK